MPTFKITSAQAKTLLAQDMLESALNKLYFSGGRGASQAQHDLLSILTAIRDEKSTWQASVKTGFGGIMFNITKIENPMDALSALLNNQEAYAEWTKEIQKVADLERSADDPLENFETYITALVKFRERAIAMSEANDRQAQMNLSSSSSSSGTQSGQGLAAAAAAAAVAALPLTSSSSMTLYGPPGGAQFKSTASSKTYYVYVAERTTPQFPLYMISEVTTSKDVAIKWLAELERTKHIKSGGKVIELNMPKEKFEQHYLGSSHTKQSIDRFHEENNTPQTSPGMRR